MAAGGESASPAGQNLNPIHTASHPHSAVLRLGGTWPCAPRGPHRFRGRRPAAAAVPSCRRGPVPTQQPRAGRSTGPRTRGCPSRRLWRRRAQALPPTPWQGLAQAGSWCGLSASAGPTHAGPQALRVLLRPLRLLRRCRGHYRTALGEGRSGRRGRLVGGSAGPAQQVQSHVQRRGRRAEGGPIAGPAVDPAALRRLHTPSARPWHPPH